MKLNDKTKNLIVDLIDMIFASYDETDTIDEKVGLAKSVVILGEIVERGEYNETEQTFLNKLREVYIAKKKEDKENDSEWDKIFDAWE